MYNKRLIFWAACAGILFFGISITTLGSVIPELKTKFELDELAFGTLFSLLPFGLMVGSLIFGPFCDRYGYKFLLSLACISMFIGFEGIAYAPSQTLLQVCIFLFGLGGGAINGATSALVSDISEENKGANLSLLGVFFAIGALGMPFILGILDNAFSYDVIVSIVGFVTLALAIFYLVIRFPLPKQAGGIPVAKSLHLFKDNVLLLIAFFLFFQSAFEGIINNWTTTYLGEHLSMAHDSALFALSLSVVGMTVMRLLLGSVFRNTPAKTIWIISFLMILSGLVLLTIAQSFIIASTGLILTGGGLAAGFPIMLGFVGNRYKDISATAFSLVFVIALAGNTIINYGMGYIAQNYGVKHLVTVGFAELGIMSILCVLILRKIKINQ